MTAPRQVAAIVVGERSRSRTALEVTELETFATAKHFSLLSGRVLVVESDAELAVLLTRLPLNEVAAILVETIAPLGAWLAEMRHHAEVWTVTPRCRWPARPPQVPRSAARLRQRW